jgi:uncharacterized membrane protein YcaP (DUF421 family)
MDMPAIEIVLWGVVLYFLLLVLLRHVLRRHGIYFSFAESLLLILFADASQNAMAGESISLTESTLLAASLVGCHIVVCGSRSLARRLRRARMAQGLQELRGDIGGLYTTVTERKPS